MTTSIKKYQNVSYKELILYAENNPNRHLSLDSIEIDIPKEESTLTKLGLQNYTASIITPSGILGILTYIADPNYYYLAPQNVRMELLIALTTKLQQQTDELKHTSLSRKRKKIYDLIGSACNGNRFEDKDYLDLFHAVSVMCSIHFILIKESVQDRIEDDKKECNADVKGEIIFSSNPLHWKRENPVWITDYRGQWIAMPMDKDNTMIGSWLHTMEQSGWSIVWPEVEGTKIEIVEKLSILPNWQEQDKKLSKDVLSLQLGKTTTMNLFKDWLL